MTNPAEMKPIPDDPTESGPGPASEMSDEQIEAALQGKPPAPVVEAVEEEPEIETPSPASEPGTEGEPPPESGEPPDLPEIDEVELARREGESERDRLRAQLELQKAHGSRLAGEIGDLKKRLTPESRQEPERDASEVYGGDGDSLLAQRLDRIEGRLQSDARKQGILEELNALSSMPELKEINDTHLAKATQMYADDLKTVNEIDDPTIARQMARAVIKNVVAEARGIALSEIREQMSKRSVTQKADLIKAKKAAGPTTAVKSSAVARPKAKTIAEMSDAEIERATDEAVARSA